MNSQVARMRATRAIARIIVLERFDANQDGWLCVVLCLRDVAFGTSRLIGSGTRSSVRRLAISDVAQLGVAGASRAASLVAARRFITLSNWVIA